MSCREKQIKNIRRALGSHNHVKRQNQQEPSLAGNALSKGKKVPQQNMMQQAPLTQRSNE